MSITLLNLEQKLYFQRLGNEMSHGLLSWTGFKNLQYIEKAGEVEVSSEKLSGDLCLLVTLSVMCAGELPFLIPSALVERIGLRDD